MVCWSLTSKLFGDRTWCSYQIGRASSMARACPVPYAMKGTKFSGVDREQDLQKAIKLFHFFPTNFVSHKYLASPRIPIFRCVCCTCFFVCARATYFSFPRTFFRAWMNCFYTGQSPDVHWLTLCAFCREVVPIKPFTNTAFYHKMTFESEPTPPCYKMCLWFSWWTKSQCRITSVTTRWLCLPILWWKRVAVKNHDSLLNGFWEIHLKSLVHFPGPSHSICRAQVSTTLGFPSDSNNWRFKKISTTMFRAMGQQTRSMRIVSNSFWFWKQICPIFRSYLKIPHKKKIYVFRIF